MAQTSPLAIRSLAPPLYRPRQPQNSALYQLLEAYYEDVKAVWEERFQKTYGFWRGFIDTVVARYLDCGVEENGFARLKRDGCGSERLLTLSCTQRGICPSCDAKRAAAFAAFLKDELLENVGHQLLDGLIRKAGQITQKLSLTHEIESEHLWKGKCPETMGYGMHKYNGLLSFTSRPSPRRSCSPQDL